MAAIRYYLFSIFSVVVILLTVVATPLVGLWSARLGPSTSSLLVLLSLTPAIVLVAFCFGSRALYHLLKAIGNFEGAKNACLAQIYKDEWHCHPDGYNIDNAVMELCNLGTKTGEIDLVTKTAWSVCDWKELNTRTIRPGHTKLILKVATELRKHGFRKEAQSLIEQLVDRRQSIFGDSHIAVAEAYLHLGNCYSNDESAAAKQAYEQALRLVQMEVPTSVCSPFSDKDLRSDIKYLLITVNSNLATLARETDDIVQSEAYLDKCIEELKKSKIDSMSLACCRDIVLAQRAQSLLERGETQQIKALYQAFRRAAPSNIRVALETAKISASKSFHTPGSTMVWLLAILFFGPMALAWWLALVYGRPCILAAHRD